MFQLGDRFENIPGGAMGVLFLVLDAVLFSKYFLERTHVDHPVMQVLLEPGEVAVDEPPIVADRVSAEDDPVVLMRLSPVSDGQRDELVFHLAQRSAGRDGRRQPAFSVVFFAPGVHPVQYRVRLKHDVLQFLDRIEIKVSHERGDFQNMVILVVEAGHLKVHPEHLLRHI